MSQIHGVGGVHSKALNLVGQRVHILAQVHVSAEGIFIHGNLRDACVDGVALSFVHGHSALFQQLVHFRIVIEAVVVDVGVGGVHDALEQRVRVGVAAGAHDEHIPAELLVEFIRREARPRGGEHRALDNFQLGVDADFLEFFRDDFCHFHSAVVHCAGHDGHIKAVRIASFRQQLLRLFRVVGHNADRGVTRHIGRHDAVNRGFAQATVEVFADGVAVDGIADGGDDVAVRRPVVVGEVEENAAVVRRRHVIERIAVRTGEALGVLRVKQRQIQLAGLQLHGLRVVVGDDLEDHAVDLRRAEVVVLVLHQHDRLARVPALELIRAGADGAAEKVGLLHILSREQMLREDPHRHILQKRHVRLGEAEGDRPVVHHGDLLDILIVRRVLGAVLGVHDGLDGELDVIRRERLAVVPLHALAQVEGIGIGLLVIVPRLGEAGDDLVVAVVGGQAVEE